MSRGPAEIHEQPQERRPRREFNLKIRQLKKLRIEIEVLRAQYRDQPTRENEIALQRLIAAGDMLHCDVAFGIAPKPGK